MAEEIETHFALRIEELRALGLSEVEATAEARRRFGDPEEFRAFASRRAGERARRLVLRRWGAEGVQDVRIALRQFRRARLLYALIVITLAVCIGATTATYGVVRHDLLDPLPYPDGNRIASLKVRSPGDGFVQWPVGTDLLDLWMSRVRSLTDFAAYVSGRDPIDGKREGAPTRDSVLVARITPSFLPMLRVRPTMGRNFTANDTLPGAGPVAMISEGTWRGRFGGAPDILGRPVAVNGVRRAIIGVVPPDVHAPIQDQGLPAVWLPLALDSTNSAYGFARLRRGVSAKTASRDLEAVLRTLPDTGWLHGRHGQAVTPQDWVGPKRRRALEVLFAAAGSLLLIACADVAGLLLMRGWARRREFAIRRALGAWNFRLVRQLLAESLLLAVPSGLLGLAVAWLALRGMVVVGRPTGVSIDLAGFVWTAVVSMGTALTFGIGPGVLAGRQSIEEVLRGGGPSASRGRSAQRAHAALVVTQVALSLVFLASAAVLARSFVALVRTPVGYRPDSLFAVHARLPDAASKHSGDANPSVIAGESQSAFAAMPGVRAVAIGTQPLTNFWSGPTAVEGPAGVRPSGVPLTGGAYVGPRYFAVAGIPLVRGRGFDRDPAVAAHEVIINQTLAHQLWPEGGALGRRLRMGSGPHAVWLVVVGIAGNVHMPGQPPEFFNVQMYRPSTAASHFGGWFIVRGSGGAATLRSALARGAERAGVGAIVDQVVAASATFDFAFNGPRFALQLFAAFTVLAVLLAAVGLFGVVSFVAARRTREIGIRMALGAEPGAIARAILSHSVRLVVIGCGVGLLGAYGAGHALRALVYNVSPTDPVALGVAAALLLAIGLCAAAIPVRRALRVDPVDVLRAD